MQLAGHCVSEAVPVPVGCTTAVGMKYPVAGSVGVAGRQNGVPCPVGMIFLGLSGEEVAVCACALLASNRLSRNASIIFIWLFTFHFGVVFGVALWRLDHCVQVQARI
jgi:hypothetical protein